MTGLNIDFKSDCTAKFEDGYQIRSTLLVLTFPHCMWKPNETAGAVKTVKGKARWNILYLE